MSSLSDIARLNLLIELFSECANAGDLETLLRVAAVRLRWIIDFDRCIFAVTRAEEHRCWLASRVDETLRRARFAELPAPEATLIASVLDTSAPAGRLARSVCVPIQVTGRTVGAICFSSEAGSYTYRDIRLAHHAGQFLGSLVSRMDLEEETRRLSKRKDDILALLGHELRNPLAPIVTAVQLLKMRSDGQPSRELDVIDRQARHLVRLVDDLLDVARLTHGKMSIHVAPLEIAQVVARAVEMVSPLFEQRRHTLDVDVPSAGLAVDADEGRLAQIMANLLSNAAHYTPLGGHVRVAARRDGETVVIEVVDDGVGIAPDALSNIFDLFVQGPDRPSGPGGLGLGVVRHLTELHGGTVSVASEGAGRGTTFTVRLPSIPATSVAPAPAAGPLVLARATTSRRVLFVDDNEDAVELLAALVADAGHEVVVAHDGPQALAALERFDASVAVIDIGLPVMTGYELAVRIRALPRSANAHLVALTGYGLESDRQRSRVAGFDDHLVKPVDVRHLLRVLADAHSP